MAHTNFKKVTCFVNLDHLPSLTQTLKDHGIWANKALGQNFLLDQNITDRIARAACINDANVIEVGPGPGGLTRSLLRAHAKRVIAIEKDTRFIALLQDLVQASQQRLMIEHHDATRVTVYDLIEKYSLETPVHIVANLPYNVGTHLLIDWLHQTDVIASMTLMFQKEVADRITAKPNIPGVLREVSQHYGRLSILSQYICDVQTIQILPPTAFTPPPKVHSAVVRFIPRHISAQERQLLPHLEKVTHLAFQQRRKMLSTSLKSIFSMEDFDMLEKKECGIMRTHRPENLPLAAFVAMAEHIQTNTHKTITP